MSACVTPMPAVACNSCADVFLPSTKMYIDRWRAAGYKLLRNFWAHPEDEAAIRLYAEKLQRRRDKAEK